MRASLAPFAVLLLLLVGCDSEGPATDPEPDAFFVANVRDGGGGAAAGLDLFLVYGSLSGQPSTQARQMALDASGPFPNPAVTLTLIQFTTPSSGRTTVEVFDVAGTRVETAVDDTFSPSDRVQIALRVDNYLAGVYRVRITGGGETAERILVKTDSAGDGASAGLAIYLGTTDASGRVLVNDRTRFPSLFDVPAITVSDDTGQSLAEFRLSADATLVLQDRAGNTSRKDVRLRDAATQFDLVFAP